VSAGLLGLVYDYRSLLGRRDLVRMPLDDDERDRLAELEQRFLWNRETTNGSQPMGALRRRYLRLGMRIPALIKVGVTFEPTTIVDIGGGGIRIEPGPALRLGDVTVVKVTDAAGGREYHLPVQVVWIAGRRAGLAFFGIPIALRFGGGRTGRADDAAA
jgi:hypothetical protein